MSTGNRIPWDDAVKIAKDISDALAPVAVRTKVVGSVRRRRPTVGDIEFLVEPRLIDADLFGEKKPHVQPILARCEEWGTIEKSGDRMIQVDTLMGIEGLKLDLYLVSPPANWWCLLAIRTGPWELGRLAVFPHAGLRTLPPGGPHHRPDRERAPHRERAGLL